MSTTPMDYEQAPAENLQTWGLVKRILFWSCVVTAIVLGLMAVTLT